MESEFYPVLDYFRNYFLPLGFFITWLIWPRKGLSKFFSWIIIFCILIAALFTIITQLTETRWDRDIKSTRAITQIIEQQINTDNMKNVNIAVLASLDNNTYGRRYRDLLLIKGVEIKTKYEYFITDNLFVITTADEDTLRQDAAAEMNNFRNGKLEKSWVVPNSPWSIFLFDRNPS